MLFLLYVVLFIILITCFVIACKKENKRFTVTEYAVYSDKLNKPVTLAVLSDLHNYKYGPDNQELYDKIDSIHPDYVVSAGDMIEGAMFAKGTYDTVRFLEKLSRNFHFIYGCGNHEWKLINDRLKYPQTTTEFERGLRDSKEAVSPLHNENVDCPLDGIKFYGLDLGMDYFIKLGLRMTDADYISELVGSPADDRFNILIGHNPDQFPAYSDWGADLVLAGHVHGGMIATPWHRGLISPRFLPFPKYDWGEYNLKNTKMILSRGLGNHTVHIRIFNRAELVVVRLLPKE